MILFDYFLVIFGDHSICTLNKQKSKQIMARTLVLLVLSFWVLLEMAVIYGIYYPIGSFLTFRPLNNIWSKLHTNDGNVYPDDELYVDKTPLDTLIRRYNDIVELLGI